MERHQFLANFQGAGFGSKNENFWKLEGPKNFWLWWRVPPILGYFIEVETVDVCWICNHCGNKLNIFNLHMSSYHRNQKTLSSGCFLKTFDCGDVCHQSSATLSRWRQSPRSPTVPSHLTPHLYWNLNDTICALPRRKVWIWHFEFTFGIWYLWGFGASPSQDQYWSVNDTIWELWKAPSWREDNKAEIIRLLQLIQL